MNTKINKLRKALLWVRVLKGEVLENGVAVTMGLNKWNPLAWVIFILGSLAVGGEAFFRGIIASWKEFWA